REHGHEEAEEEQLSDDRSIDRTLGGQRTRRPLEARHEVGRHAPRRFARIPRGIRLGKDPPDDLREPGSAESRADFAPASARTALRDDRGDDIAVRDLRESVLPVPKRSAVLPPGDRATRDHDVPRKSHCDSNGGYKILYVKDGALRVYADAGADARSLRKSLG